MHFFPVTFEYDDDFRTNSGTVFTLARGFAMIDCKDGDWTRLALLDDNVIDAIGVGPTFELFAIYADPNLHIRFPDDLDAVRFKLACPDEYLVPDDPG